MYEVSKLTFLNGHFIVKRNFNIYVLVSPLTAAHHVQTNNYTSKSQLAEIHVDSFQLIIK